MWPQGFSLEAYKTLFANSDTLNGFYVSVSRSVIGTAATMFVSCMAAYAITKGNVPGVRFARKFFVFTMYFGGGLVPYYIVVKSLGLVGTFLVYIIPALVSVFGVIIIRAFIESLPPALEESAMIDGANEIVIFWKILFPMCMPIVAAISMFTFVGQWNSFFDTMLFNFMNRELYTLQFYLYMILTSKAVSLQDAQEMGKAVTTNSQTITMAVTVITILPILIIFPFIQRYFRSGLLIGAIKA
ncbi:carbohydrate ABC transporter permease [Paenibacillus eucommiae]|uniref:Aldouronate transport system permease protein n=1 Tax=Paenibacillus eucommiae TaxID=1355755 RepID=A0ABS4J8A7_9BACL|nr:carbohydrate ABC transporter permease [Paenibacillus eucommiae]MBP1996082.1 putative aldouronate transport system permease protein [Paenibacillus eucommiae]